MNVKRKFIFFTKTIWDEPPRIRHQLAKLLSANGHVVYFHEKPTLWPKRIKKTTTHLDEIKFLQHMELIHHKLRINRFIHEANAIYTVRSIKKGLIGVDVNENDIIVNFNYEYFFLRRIFPRNKIITIINDDFISRALFGYTAPLFMAQAQCIRASDKVLAVSLPLVTELEKIKKVELFMPWADKSYTSPNTNSSGRDTLMFWGYVNNRIDFNLIDRMLSDENFKKNKFKILFVGPIAKGTTCNIERFKGYENFEHLGAMDLDALNLDEVLAGIIPYRENDPTINAITLSNKALQILTRGIPILVSGMPNFIQAPFIFNLVKDDFVGCLQKISGEFSSLQPFIEEFVGRNSAQSRLDQFLQD